MQPHGKNVLLTGAAGGIGGAIAHALAAEGANLLLTDRPGAELQERALALASRYGVRVETLSAELTDRAAIVELARRAETVLGPIDILINNAGVEMITFFGARTQEDLAAAIDVNLTAPVLLTHLLLPGMLERGRGHIVTMSSIAGKLVIPYDATYSTTKHGLSAFMRSLSGELETDAVQCSTIFPTAIRNAGMGVNLVGEKETWGQRLVTRTPEQVADKVVVAIKTGRLETIVSPPGITAWAIFGVAFPGMWLRMFRKTLGPVARKWIIEAGRGSS